MEENKTTGERRYKIYNKNILDGKLIEIGEKEIHQTKNICKMQENLKANSCNYDFEEYNDIFDDNFDLEMELGKNEKEDSSSEDEIVMPNALKQKTKNIEDNQLNKEEDIFQKINSTFISYNKKIISHKTLI